MIQRLLLTLTAALLFSLTLPTAAHAVTDYTAQCVEDNSYCVFDSNAAAWFEKAATWPGAGPIFDARDLVEATYLTWTVLTHTVETHEIDEAHFGQTVCRGDARYCPEPYVRDCCLSFQEGNSELWHMIFSRPVWGILFDGHPVEGHTWETSEFSLNPTYIAGGRYRSDFGLPEYPTSSGFLTNHLVFELHGRQNREPESEAWCCPVPLFAVGPLAPTPEPSTVLLVGSGLSALGAGAWRRRSLRDPSP